MNDFLKSYLNTALWASNDDNGDPLDINYSIGDFSIEAIEKAKKDCNEFKLKIEKFNLNNSNEEIAHDFWLTRNRHGVGFWDGNYEKDIGKKLTDISQIFKEVCLYVNNDKVEME